MSNLYLLSGVPGSGKSYIAKKLGEMYVNDKKIKYISRDEIRFSLLNDDEDYFSKENLVFDTFVNKIQEALDNGADVIADSTLITVGSRRKLLSRLHLSDNTRLVGCNVSTALNVCLARNANREGRAVVPPDVIEKMWNSYSPITEDELKRYCNKNTVYTILN